jgi:hypothetical protein
MVPALASTSTGKNRAYWDEWVRRGKPGTFMPAFGKRWGGPLTEPEVESLLEFLITRFSD